MAHGKASIVPVGGESPSPDRGTFGPLVEGDRGRKSSLAFLVMTSRRLALVALTLLLFLLPASPAAADSTPSGGDTTVAQTLGDRDLTVILRRVTSVPGPLRVDVITHAGTAAGTLTLAVTAASTGTRSSMASVSLGAAPGSYGATLRVAAAGSWELSISDGQQTARVPFVATAPAISPAERLVYIGFLGAGVLLLAAVVVAVRARRIWWVAVPGAGMVAGLAVAITGALLSASLPMPPQPGIQLDATEANSTDPYQVAQPLVADYSRPPAQMAVGYRHGTLTLTLTDASTGLPADDLVVHDDALIHLMVVGPSGRLWHVHPIRTAPGIYQVHLPLPEAGHYAVAAELGRRGGGVQMLRSPTGIDVSATGATQASATGTAHAGAAGEAQAGLTLTARRTATTTVSGVPVEVTSTAATVGTAVTLTVKAGATATLQPWLGMLGHLVLVGPVAPTGSAGTAAQAAPTWAHAHSMGDLTPAAGMAGMSGTDDGSMSDMSGLMPVNGDSAADETVAAYGPQVSFTYTFAQAGGYRLWIQVERDYRVLTIPVRLKVAAR